MAYFDEHGNEIQGLHTQEEVDKKIAESSAGITEKHEAEKKESEAKVTAAEKEVADAKTALEKAGKGGEGGGDGGGEGGGGDKDENMAALRKKVDDAEAAREKAEKENAERWSKQTGDVLVDAITSIAKDDKDIADKIKHHYDTTLSGVNAQTPSEIKEKVANAAKLASVPAQTINPMDVALGGGPGKVQAPAGDKKEYSAEDKQFGKKLGVSDKDYEKYGNDPRLTGK